MGIVLTTPQREQAGSMAYNRFEYQAHWIVYHILDYIDQKKECIVFCEFHDDMAECDLQGKEYQFYQVKTKDKYSDWTVAEMSQREKKSSGTGYKKSFLGFIFYNFMKFGNECANCYFVSNQSFDEEVLTWQACIEDELLLIDEHPNLYEKIKNRISQEYLDDMPADFNDIFDRFIQHTYVSQAELKLDTYEDQTIGVFFRKFSKKNIPSQSLDLIFEQLLNDVRKKSKKEIRSPISFKRLTQEKGINIVEISNYLENSAIVDSGISRFQACLSTLGLDEATCRRLVSAKYLHDANWINPGNILYHKTISEMRIIIEQCSVYNDSLDDVKQKCKMQVGDSLMISDDLIEVLYYERLFH